MSAIPKTPIRLGQAVDLHPLGFYQTNVLAFGGPGAGKTTLQRLFYERAPKQFQQVIIDTEDELHTLRADGREYVIMGGEFADAPGLIDMDWYALAAVVVKTGANWIFQINDWSISDQREFIGQLVKGLLATPRTEWRPMIFGLDESDQFAPNGPTVASSEALVMLAKRGRKRGWSCLFATQRISMLSADLRGMCSNIAIGVANQSLDVKAGAQAIGVSPTSAEAKALLTLRRGQFFLGGPAFDVRPPALFTTDMSDSRAPEPGSGAPPASKSSAAILKALSAIPMAEETAEETAAATDPGKPARVEYRTDPAALDRARAVGAAEGRAKALQDAARWLRARADQVDAEAAVEFNGAINMPLVTTPERANKAAASVMHKNASEMHKPNGKAEMSAAAMHILGAFAEYYPRELTFKHAHKIKGRSVTSSNFGRVVKELTEAGAVENTRGDFWRLSEWMANSMGAQQMPKAPAEIVAMWRAKLEPAQARMLDAIVARGRFSSRGEWAEASGVSPTSSNVGRVAGELAALELIVEDAAGIRLHPDLT